MKVIDINDYDNLSLEDCKEMPNEFPEEKIEEFLNGSELGFAYRAKKDSYLVSLLFWGEVSIGKPWRSWVTREELPKNFGIAWICTSEVCEDEASSALLIEDDATAESLLRLFRELRDFLSPAALIKAKKVISFLL